MRLWGPALGLAATLGCGAGYELASATGVATSTASATNGSTGEGTWVGTWTGEPGGAGFIVEHDSGGGTFECNPWLQDCPEGTKCMPWATDGGNAWNATKCAPLDPNPVGLYETCVVQGSGVSGVDNCEFGVMCWNVNPESNEGECIGMCQGSQQNPSCDDPDAICAIYDVLILCHQGCDPLLQDCDEGQGCYPVLPAFICVPDGSGPDGGAAGDPCEFLNACDPGLLCIEAGRTVGCTGALGCCSPLCNLSDPAASAACPGAPAEYCKPWFEPGAAQVGFEHVGICAITEGG